MKHFIFKPHFKPQHYKKIFLSKILISYVVEYNTTQIYKKVSLLPYLECKMGKYKLNWINIFHHPGIFLMILFEHISWVLGYQIQQFFDDSNWIFQFKRNIEMKKWNSSIKKFFQREYIFQNFIHFIEFFFLQIIQ